MTCHNCTELTERLITGRERFAAYRGWTTESLDPLLSAIANLDTQEGRMNFVMSGPRAMERILQLYRELPEELKVKP